jgi:hypothetical protein
LAIPGYAQFDVTLHTVTSRPLDCLNKGRKVKVTEIVPKRLTLHAASNSSTGVHSEGAKFGITPALFTKPQRPEEYK